MPNKSSKLNICHVITRMIVGGAQENTLYSIRGLLEHGHNVTLVTGPSTGPEGSLLQRFCPPGMTIIELPELIRAISPLRDFRCERHLEKIFRENHFDVVHTHSSKAGILGRIAARRAGIPFVCHTVHGQAFHPYQGKIKNTLYISAERIAASYCDKIYAVAQAMIDQCVAAHVAPKEKYQVVYSGMDLGSFANAQRDMTLRTSLGIPENAKVVGMVARLFELKGHSTLISSAPKIIAEHPDVRFLFVGDGILKEQLQQQCKALGLERYFVFAGLIPPEHVPDYIAQMDILAHLSLREGLPRACVQALAAAKPAVAYPLDGTPEVILNEKTGLLVPVENSIEIAGAINRLLSSESLCRSLGQTGQKLVLERFDWHRMANILEMEYINHLQSVKTELP